MDRKYFLSSVLTAAVVFPSFKSEAGERSAAESKKIRIPPYLNQGDLIGICSPAGYISTEAIQPSIALMQSWGFKVQVGSSVGKRDHTFGGTDAERLADLQAMLDHPDIKAIMCARGGYGLVRIIEQLNFKSFAARPKWIIGFSDVTVLHNHIHQNYQVATLHSKMCNSFPDDWTKAEPIQISTILSIKQALMAEDFKYTAKANPFNKPGKAEGQLVGGNLSIIASLSGTRSDIDTKGKILFIEDTGEYLYSLDRMLWNLKQSGKLSKLAGLIIGGFKIKPDPVGEEFGQSIYEIVLDKAAEYGYPICFDFPVGHQRDNFALKCGVQHQLNVSGDGAALRSL